MKKFSIILIAICTIVIILIPTFAASNQTPSLFYNDEPWYKDQTAPLVYNNDIYHVPAELFSMFDNVSVTFPKEENLLIHNSSTNEYISILFSVSKAITNGSLHDISVFRDGSVYYVDAEVVCRAIGLSFEYNYSNDNKTRMRIFESEAVDFTFDDILAAYAPEETTPPATDPEISDTSKAKKQIFLCCGPGLDPWDNVIDYAAITSLREYNLSYTVFLKSPTTARAILESYVRGSYGITSAVGASSPEAYIRSLNETNKNISEFTNRYTHYTLSTGKANFDSAMNDAGYFPISTPFNVNGNSSIKTMFAEITEYLEKNDYCIIYLEDCWNSSYMAKLISSLDKEKYVTANLSAAKR